MTALGIVLAVLSCLALAAHLFRAGWLLGAAVVAAAPLLLLARRAWATRAVAILLALGALEWLRTLALLVAARREAGAPYLRLAAILGAVSLVGALAAYLLGSRARR